MGQLTPRGQSKAAEEAAAGKDQATGSANCAGSTGSPRWIELDIMIRLGQKLGEEEIINVIEDVPSTKRIR